jgi:carbon storage regulator CsrA
MLVLSRRLQERILFPSIDTLVQVVAIKPNLVRLGIEAPPEVTMLREELQGRAAVELLSGMPAAGMSGEAASLALDHVLQVVTAGIAEARLQLQAGRAQDGEMLLAKIQKDLEQLRQLAAPAPARRRRCIPARRLPAK